MQIVLLFPGQGSQKPGMGKELAAVYPAAASVFHAMDATLGVSLSTLLFEGPDDELTRTINAQPALLAHSAAAWAVVKGRLATHVVAAAGHSLGEFSAYHAAGALTLSSALTLVRRRGELMFETGDSRPGAMAAIIGDLSKPIEAVCADASAAGIVVPANYNCPGQIVISGETRAVERAMELAKAAGAKRAIKLNVSGAFHSPLMEPAIAGLERAIRLASLTDAHFPVFANVDGEPYTAAGNSAALLLRQLTSPVRWATVVGNLATRFPQALFVELGAGAVLQGLVKKIASGVQVVSCGTPTEVELLLAKVA